jgi:enoyl-CoA hydratase/carnithine racemase
VKAVVVTGEGGNFCSGGDVHEIIGPLTKMTMPELLEFTRMTGDLVKPCAAARSRSSAPSTASVRGAGAMMALASDLRYGHRHQDRLPVHPRGPGRRRHGRLRAAAAHDRPGARERAAVHRPRDDGEKAWPGASSTRCTTPADLLAKAQAMAAELAAGPTFAHGMTKTMLQQEWAMTIEQAIEAEAQAQAICMQTQDFRRAYDAFAAKQKPVFGGD